MLMQLYLLPKQARGSPQTDSNRGNWPSADVQDSGRDWYYSALHVFIPLCPVPVGDAVVVGQPCVDVGLPLDLLDELPVLPRDGVVVGAVRHGRPPEGLVREPVLEARPLRRARRVQHHGTAQAHI